MTAAERVRAVRDRVVHSRVARQVGGLTGARGAAAAISFLWLALAARWLSLPEFADLALLLSLGAVVSVVADFGYPLVLNEALAAEPARSRSSLVIVLRRRIGLAVVASVVMAALYRAGANDDRWIVPAVFTVSVLATAWHTSCSAALRGAVSVVPEAANEVLARVFVLLAGTTLLANGPDLLAAVAVYAAADVVSAVGLTLVSWRRLPAGGPADLPRFRMRRVLPLGMASIAAVVYYRIDIWLLAVLSTASEVASYSICYRVLDALVLPAGAMAAVSIGSTARLDNASAVRRTDRMAALVCLCLFPAIVVLAFIPGVLLELGFGPRYSSAGPVLRILALAIPPSVAVLVWAPLLALRGRGIGTVTLFCLAVTVGLNLALIPGLGGEGAAWATVLGQVTFAVLVRLRLRALAAGAPAPTELVEPELALHVSAAQG